MATDATPTSLPPKKASENGARDGHEQDQAAPTETIGAVDELRARPLAPARERRPAGERAGATVGTGPPAPGGGAVV